MPGGLPGRGEDLRAGATRPSTATSKTRRPTAAVALERFEEVGRSVAARPPGRDREAVRERSAGRGRGDPGGRSR
ncbi:hypothetical protein D5H78_02735 [Vallicoccus soli]|uniref:Uncharacterized protein n=1 Tax=Vallicoccus soli TaxID=2339232 RepID=A0A3A3Z0X2_9ACTN|nr:hypothetical protein D5H78_02735 [Vallicoccus soli]